MGKMGFGNDLHRPIIFYYVSLPPCQNYTPPQHSHIYIHKKILILSGHPRSSFYLQPSFPSLLLGIGIQPCHVLLEASRWTTTAPSTQLNLMLVDGQISEKQTQLARYLMECHSRSSLIFGTKVTVILGASLVLR